jgi:hypothetical protein
MAPNHVKTGRDPPRSCGGDEARRATEAPIDACFHEVAEALGQRGRRRRRCRSRRQAAVTGTAYDTARVAACGTKPATRASPTTRARQHDGGLSTRDSPPFSLSASCSQEVGALRRWPGVAGGCGCAIVVSRLRRTGQATSRPPAGRPRRGQRSPIGSGRAGSCPLSFDRRSRCGVDSRSDVSGIAPLVSGSSHSFVSRSAVLRAGSCCRALRTWRGTCRASCSCSLASARSRSGEVAICRVLRVVGGSGE